MHRIITLIFIVLFSLNTFSQETSIIDMSALNDSNIIINHKLTDAQKIYEYQEIKTNEDSILKNRIKEPSFAAYKDNYFITGLPLNKEPTRKTVDVKFQVSIRQRITNSILPFNSFLYLTYTQKSFWNLYDKSSPFRDTNYNPGLGIGKHIVHKNVFLGTIFIQAEHESNGQGDSTLSRSWNYLSFAGKFFYNTFSSLQVKFWLPLVDGGANQDLLVYRGLCDFSFNTITPNRLWWFTAEINPREKIGKVNLNLSLGYRLSQKSNQYLYVQLFNGYSEGLLNYNKYSHMLRVGFCIKPDFFSAY